MSYADKIRLKVIEDIIHTKQEIKVVEEKGMFNFRCYENAVQYAFSNDNCEVHEVFYIDNRHPVLHYVVKQDDIFKEVTIGFLAQNVKYYYLRKINKDDWRAIGWVFETAVDYWQSKYLNWFHKYILRIDRIL